MNSPTPLEIAALEDRVLRNLWITQTYHDLGVRLADRGLGADSSWLFFAVWASKTAGGIIRGDELPALIRQRTSRSAALVMTTGAANRTWTPLRALGLVSWMDPGHLIKTMDRVAADVSRLIAEGNLLVFNEIAPVFAALIEGRQVQTAPALASAVDDYQAALGEKDSRARAAHVLRANVTVVAHEQQRLQRYIAGALDAVVDEGLLKVVDDDIVRHLPSRLVRAWARNALQDVCRELNRVWQEIVTETVMRLVTADEHLDLHQTLPPPPGEALFVPPLDGADAASAVLPWDLTGGDGCPCGADDWTVLEQRMGYIVNLFRSRQRRPSLSNPPFSHDQIAAMEDSRVPAGPL